MQKMKGKICISFLITTLLISSVFASGAIVKETGKLEKTSKLNELENKEGVVDKISKGQNKIEFSSNPISKSDENEMKTYKPVYNAHDKSMEDNLDIQEVSWELVELKNIEKRDLINPKVYEIQHTVDLDQINFGNSKTLDLTPPWDDHYNDSSASATGWAILEYDSWSNSYEGGTHDYGSAAFIASGTALSWCGFFGHWDCQQGGLQHIYFDFNVEGEAATLQIPSPWSLAEEMEIGALVLYKFADEDSWNNAPVYSEEIWYKDGFEFPHTYPIDWDKIGHIMEDCEAGTTYYFQAEFHSWVTVTSIGISCVKGRIDLTSAKLEEVHITAEEKPELFTYTVYTVPPPGILSRGEPNALVGSIILNMGAASCNDFIVRFYFDDSYWEWRVHFSGGLPPGYGFYFNVTLDPGWPNDLDWHLVGFEPDPYPDWDEIDEEVETNNFLGAWIRAVGDSDLEIEDMTLIQQPDDWPQWPLDWVDWQHAQLFDVGNRVNILGKISNIGEGPSDEFIVYLYIKEDGNWNLFAQSDPVMLGAQSYAIAYVVSGNEPGFNWPDSSCHKFKYVVDNSEYDERIEEYCPGDNDPPDVEITRPTGGIYIADIKFIDLAFLIIIIGRITIEVDASDSGSGMDYVEFYIDNELKYTDHNPPWEWTWKEHYSFKRMKITAKAYDNAGNSADDEIFVWKFIH